MSEKADCCLCRKGAEYFYKKADSLYEAGRLCRMRGFAKFVLTEHPGFLQQKKYRELFEFAWQSSNDELLRVLYKSRDYEGCVDAVDHIFAHAHHLTTFWPTQPLSEITGEGVFSPGSLWNRLARLFFRAGRLADIVCRDCLCLWSEYRLSDTGGQWFLSRQLS